MPKVFKGDMEKKAYTAWMNAKARCNPTRVGQKEAYIRNGITMCDEWKNSFERFLEDMGLPEVHLTLERADNNKGYNPQNCYWATTEEQAGNRGMRKDNKSGIKGVFYSESRGKWTAATSSGKQLYWGYDFFEACCKRKSWEAKQDRCEV